MRAFVRRLAFAALLGCAACGTTMPFTMPEARLASPPPEKSPPTVAAAPVLVSYPGLEVSYVRNVDGNVYRYRDVSIAPRPRQSPLPCWIGGASDAAVRRTARLGTGWLGGAQSPAEVRAVIEAIRKELVATGRSIDADHYGASVAFHFGSWDDADLARIASARSGRSASPEQARAQLAVGDARHGSVKRVASAVGAGSIAIRVVHHLLEEDMAAEPMDELRELRPA